MFKLSDEFIREWVAAPVKWGPVGYVTYKRTYARPLDSISERHAELATRHGLVGTEEWWLTVLRVVEGTYEIQRRHTEANRLYWNEEKARLSAEEMYRLIFNFKFTPPGRGLWMMGTPAVDKVGGAALNNCAFVSTDIKASPNYTNPFTFLMDMSMLGVGVGFDTLGAGKIYVDIPLGVGFYKIPDTREGWVKSVELLLKGYFYGEARYDFDYSEIRPYGTPIKGFGGTSSGSTPLRELHKALHNLLIYKVDSYLTSGDIVDIMNMIGRCVVAGNVRRSAELAIGLPDDKEFLSLKDYNLYPEECANWRWASNNSVAATIGMDYSDVAEKTSLNGDPGYIWLDNAREYSRMGGDRDYKDSRVMGVNPCSEQSLENFELCCLAEVFPSNHENYTELENTLKYVYLYTKTVTLVPTHNSYTNAVMLRNRRIGVSMTGIIQAMKKFGRRNFLEMCNRGYEYIQFRDKQYSDWLAVPRSIKTTSVKPSGSVSLLPGVTPGIHFPHSEYYFRVIRFDSGSPLVQSLRKAGYHCYNLEPKEPNTTAVYFPVKEEYFDRGKADVTMWEQLELAAMMQEWWADNQVSVTVTFKENEKSDIKNALECYESRLKSVSFLPLSIHGYDHAPYQVINKETYEAYVDELEDVQFLTSKNEIIERFCDGDKCEIVLT